MCEVNTVNKIQGGIVNGEFQIFQNEQSEGHSEKLPESETQFNLSPVSNHFTLTLLVYLASLYQK